MCNFVTIDNETTEEFSESILEEVEAQTVKLIPQACLELQRIILKLMKNIIQSKKNNFNSRVLMLMKTISFNAQLWSSKAVTGAGEHNKELKATCEKFQRLLFKASVTEELKLKKTSNEN